MKTSNERKAAFVEYNVPAAVSDNISESMKYFPYDRILRTLGSALEREGFSEFDLQVSRDGYAVCGSSPLKKSVSPSLFRRILGRENAGNRGDKPAMREVHYSVTDLLTFETGAREQRKQSSQMPDPYSLSQILRGVGCYMDKREGSRLARVGVKNRWVTIEYFATDGRLEKAHQDFDYFYDYWVKMYTQRGNRPKLPPLSDPTIFVTWEAAQRQHRIFRRLP